MRRRLVLALALLVLGACGRRGPLELPDEGAEDHTE